MPPESPLRWLFFLALNALAGWNAVCVVRRFCPVEGSAEFVGRAFLVWSLQVVLLQLALGAAGWLSSGTLLAAVSLLAVLLVRKGPAPAPPSPGKTVSASPGEVASRLVLALPAAFGAFWLWQFRWTPPMGTDSLIYHLPFVAEWHQTGTLTREFDPFHTIPFNAYTPFYGELFFHWLFAPLGTDFVCRFGQFPFLLAGGLSLYNIQRLAGVSAASARYSAAALVLSRPLWPLQVALANVDLMFLYFGLAFVEEALRLRHSGRMDAATLSGLALGLYLGTKYVGAVFAPALVGVLWVLTPSRVGGKSRAFTCGVVLAATVLFGGIPYLMNLQRTGNPLYPADFKVLGLMVAPGLHDPHVWESEFSEYSLLDVLTGSNDLGWPPLSGLVLLTGSLAGLLAWARLPVPDRRAAAVSLLGIPALLVLLLFSLVFYRDLRYILLAPALFLGWFGFALDALAARSRVPWFVGAGIGWLAVLLQACEGLDDAYVLTPVVGAALLAAAGAAVANADAQVRDRLAALLPLAAGAAVLALAVAGATIWERTQRRYFEARLQGYRDCFGAASLGGAWAALLEFTHDRPATIAYTGSAQIYPLYGHALENRVRYVHVQPGTHRWIHEYGRRFEGRMPTNAPSLFQALYRGWPDPEYWLSGLRSARCEFLIAIYDPVAVLHPTIETEWADARPEIFRPVFAGEGVKLYRIHFAD